MNYLFTKESLCSFKYIQVEDSLKKKKSILSNEDKF